MPVSPLALLDRVLHGKVQPLAPATVILPLQGLTLLAVEDSRFASDAMRLMCQRSGARLRRVDTLQGAYAHLRVYRPDVMLVDLGLPDGRGDTLIADLAGLRSDGPIVMGISGDAGGLAVAMMAGAHGFIEKPFASLAAFQSAILRHLPDRADRPVPVAGQVTPRADPLALRDDLEHAADLLQTNPARGQRRYLAGFVSGVARSAGDQALAAAASALATSQSLDALRALLDARLNAPAGAFDHQVTSDESRPSAPLS